MTDRPQSEAGETAAEREAERQARAERARSRKRVQQLLRGSAQAHAAPQTAGGKRRAAERIARRAVDRIVTDPEPTTQPIPLVARLKGTAYQAPVQPQAKNEDEARMILDFAVDTGRMLLRAGAGSKDVEIAVIAVCTALGLPNVEIDLTSGALTVHYADPEGRLLTVVRVTRDESLHYAKISSLHALIADIVDGKVDFDTARSRLDAIRRQPRPYPEWFITGAWAALVGAFTILVGGGPISMTLGFIMAIVFDGVGKLLGRTGVPGFFITAGQSLLATLVATVAWNFGLVSSPQYLVAAGIVLLLPTQSLLAAVEDALTSFPLTAAGKFVGVFMTFAGIVSGIAAGLSLAAAMNLRDIDVLIDSSALTGLGTVLASLAASGVVAAAGAVGMQASKRVILPAAAIGMVGFLCNWGLGGLGITGVANSFISSLVVGVLAYPVAIWRRTASIVYLIPALYPLLAGLSIFSAAYNMVGSDSVTVASGLSALFLAVATNAALAVGAVLGGFICAPLQSHLRKRITEYRQQTAESATSA